MLRIRNNIFEIDRATRNTGFFIFPNDAKGQFLDIALDISFCDNQYEGEQLAPSLCINYFQTKAQKLADLKNLTFKIESIEEADEREDSFYIYEHEPFEYYECMIVEIGEVDIRVKINGKCISDGYATPYKTETFTVDGWLPIISNRNDWDKHGL